MNVFRIQQTIILFQPTKEKRTDAKNVMKTASEGEQKCIN